MNRAREVPALQQKMLDTLSAVQKRRKEASDSSWIMRELVVMLNAVNAERHARGRAAITLNELQRRERLAQGHSDYSSKFALYCAELVLGLNP